MPYYELTVTGPAEEKPPPPKTLPVVAVPLLAEKV
jgi:hypothetical protein